MSKRPTEVTPALHSAGTTVLHTSPFDGIEIPVSQKLSSELIARWVIPFYWGFSDIRRPDRTANTEAQLRRVYSEITPTLIGDLLADRDWRPRITAAFFVALTKLPEHEDLIGRLLLRSDVCYAGYGYCVALARLNTARGVAYLCEYLDYYLTRKDLWFDQGPVLAAVHYLDGINGTAHGAKFDDPWNELVSDRPHWDLADAREGFAMTIHAIEAVLTNLSTQP
jgi:hypothetical protein